MRWWRIAWCAAHPPGRGQLRRTILSWRFYDSFRTDRHAPVRTGRLATRTPSLAADGGDLAAAVQTILEIGDVQGLQSAIAGFACSCTNPAC